MAAKSPPDGYTLVMPASSHTTTPSLYSKLSFDPVKDFVAVTQVVSVPWALVVHPSLQAKSVKEFIEFAKSKPNQLNFGSAGNGSSNHLAGELFKIMAGVKMVHVPYKGSGPAMVDLLGGHLSFMFDAINTSLEHIKAGNLRPLAVSTLRRSPIAPDLPTISESGVPGYESSTWIGVLAPAGTPKEIVTRLNNEIVKILNLPDIRGRLSKQGAEPVGSTPEQFDAFVKAQIAKWAKVIKDAGIPRVD
jgi:tripartite-type tricarboxylate transporter receptor subunit TctC